MQNNTTTRKVLIHDLKTDAVWYGWVDNFDLVYDATGSVVVDLTYGDTGRFDIKEVD